MKSFLINLFYRREADVITLRNLYDQNSIILAKMECLLFTITTRSNEIMETLESMQAAQAATEAAIAAEAIQVKEKLDALAVEIQSLKDQIAALPPGSVMTQEQLDALVATQNSITAKVEGLYVPEVVTV